MSTFTIRRAAPGPCFAARATPRPSSVSCKALPVERAALAGLAGMLAMQAALPAFAADAQQAPSTSEPLTISFTTVSSQVADKLRERDENLAWKCRGVSMYDCSGELAEKAEQRNEELKKMFAKGDK